MFSTDSRRICTKLDIRAPIDLQTDMGQTNYESAFIEALDIIKITGDYKPIIIFMTDGNSNNGDNENLYGKLLPSLKKQDPRT